MMCERKQYELSLKVCPAWYNFLFKPYLKYLFTGINLTKFRISLLDTLSGIIYSLWGGVCISLATLSKTAESGGRRDLIIVLLYQSFNSKYPFVCLINKVFVILFYIELLKNFMNCLMVIKKLTWSGCLTSLIPAPVAPLSSLKST